MIEKKIKQSLVLERTVPDYVIEEFPKFVEFTRQYYRWMEQDGQSVDRLNKILADKDVNTVTTKEHEFFILDTFLKSIPKNLSVDYAHLIRNIRAFYSEKGTDASIKAFFYLLSEARKPNVIHVEFDKVEDVLIGQVVRGTSSGAQATVISAARVSASSNLVALTLSYSTLPEYKNRSFTSLDSVVVEDGQELVLQIQDFKTTIFYPKEYLLRSSAGEYASEARCRIKIPVGFYKSYANKTFTSSSGSVGRIDRQSYSVASAGGFDYYDLTLSFNSNRNWSANETLTIDGEVVPVSNVFTNINILSGGMGYVVGDRFPIVGSDGISIGNVVVGEVKKGRIDRVTIQAGGSGYSIGDTFRFKYSNGFYGGGYVKNTILGVVSEIVVSHSNANSSEYPEVIFDSGNQSAVLFPQGNGIGSITSAYVDSVGIDVNLSASIVVPAKPFPFQSASLRFEVGKLYRTKKSFKTDGGQLSSYFRLQDNHYWQDFSYVLQFSSPINFEEHFDLFKKTVHPAGLKSFFEMRRSEDASSMNFKLDMSTERHIIRDHFTHNRISDIQFDTIESHDRLKDENYLHTYFHKFYNREHKKTAVSDSWTGFSSDILDDPYGMLSRHGYIDQGYISSSTSTAQLEGPYVEGGYVEGDYTVEEYTLQVSGETSTGPYVDPLYVDPNFTVESAAPSLSPTIATISQLSDLRTLHKYTCTMEVHSAFIKVELDDVPYFDSGYMDYGFVGISDNEANMESYSYPDYVDSEYVSP